VHKSDKSLLDLYKEGGPVMHLIALCSVLGISIGLYCFIAQSRSKLMPPALVERLRSLMAQRDVAGVLDACRSQPGALSRGMTSALAKLNVNRADLGKTSMENAIADECFREETKLMVTVNYLNTVAVMAPMIGLLGTVSGMITSFGALTAGKAEATELAGGIGEALVATAGGLLLSIPAMFAYFHFRGQVQTGMADVHKTLNELVDVLTAEDTTPQEAPAYPGHTHAHVPALA
jgi:biopolymer transport protein ExbB